MSGDDGRTSTMGEKQSTRELAVQMTSNVSSAWCKTVLATTVQPKKWNLDPAICVLNSRTIWTPTSHSITTHLVTLTFMKGLYQTSVTLLGRHIQRAGGHLEDMQPAASAHRHTTMPVRGSLSVRQQFHNFPFELLPPPTDLVHTAMVHVRVLIVY